MRAWVLFFCLLPEPHHERVCVVFCLTQSCTQVHSHAIIPVTFTFVVARGLCLWKNDSVLCPKSEFLSRYMRAALDAQDVI